ncbi:MAG: Mov34/MPN/PAD-1 family protein [Chloroflexota bacterium]|nr:Mov34/MPN/PAD-1 family protein [Chloroflexota bacterium]
MRRPVGTAWVAESALAAMAAEAERTYPLETGGVLLGYWAMAHSEVVVTDVVGPGLRAVHEPTRFVPDRDYQDAEIARLHVADPARYGYLGDWHSHPRGGAGLSAKDQEALRQIARHQAARAPVPLMAILTLSGEWRVAAWCLRPGPFWLRATGNR